MSLRRFLALFITSSLPALFLLFHICRLGVDVPFYDEWTFMGSMIDVGEKPDSIFHFLFASHNDHRIFTTKVFFFLMEKINKWDRHLFYIANFITAALTFLLIFKISTSRLKGFPTYVILFIVSCLIFNPGQFENWTWGFQIQWFHNLFLSLVTLSLLLLSPLTLKTFTLATLSAVLTSLTIAGGLFIWPTGAFGILISQNKKSAKVKYLSSWIFKGAIVWILYRQGLESKSLLKEFTSDPLLAIKTFFALLGAPICNFNTNIAMTLGVICLGLFSYCFLSALKPIFKSELESYKSLWLSWTTYALFSAVAISLARFSLGGPQYVLDASRYTTLTGIIWISIVLTLGFEFFDKGRSLATRLISTLFVIALSILFIRSEAQSRALWTYRQLILTRARNVILSYDPALLDLMQEPKEAIGRIGFISIETVRKLRAHDLSPFDEPKNLSEYKILHSNSSSGYVEEFKRGQIGETAFTEIKGWAIDPLENKNAAKFVLIVNGDNIIATVPCYISRPDVTLVKSLNTEQNSGWNFFSTESIDKSKLRFFAVSNEDLLAVEIFLLIKK